jgi:hypothetical protein
MEEIKIKKSNFKIILLSIVGILFGVLCLNMFLNPEKYISYVFRNESFIKVFGLLGFIFMSLSIILIAVKYFKNSFGLVIDKNGITDNSSVASVGLIEWKDIKGIRKNNVMSTQFLLIDVYDSDKYIKKSKNTFVSILLKTNLKTYGTPISISDKALKCSFKELESIINEQYQSYINKS